MAGPSEPERGLFSLADLAPAAVIRLARRSTELFDDREAHDRPLRDRVVGTLFTGPSTRTRTAFTVGTLRLGGTPVPYGPDDLQSSAGEPLPDTGRVLGCMLDALVARTTGPLEGLRVLSRYGQLPTVNAMAADEHPTQGICDLATLLLRFGDLSGLRLLYVGEGNSTAVALAHGLSAVPDARATFVCPREHALPERELERAAKRAVGTGARLDQLHDPRRLPREVDVVYTTRWGGSGADGAFQVNQAFVNRWPDAWFMHDLPARRGEEVSAAVLDGPRSLAWTQAAMKLPSAMAVLEWVTNSAP
ncbi:ornithine carbamoyltransferase [Streptomyces silvisoli]|uniref:Ornithine carbamoyltransferase n=1 Tax=Streptomyces silvisoli TaxID=3034235 RepID=A0ABT5ZDJ5_9ACTN|nr:ornithine carbamoyltransferase [Streptomyces silvisoli]MDF3287649.1 ornithine carbamoyltransferase [Streptomyces silvisoli]